MRIKTLTTLVLMTTGIAAVAGEATSQGEFTELLYAFQAGTDATVFSYPDPAATDIETFTYRVESFEKTSLQVPEELARALDSFEEGQESQIIKAVFVIKGSAVVWDCGFNAAGDWECKKVKH